MVDSIGGSMITGFSFIISAFVIVGAMSPIIDYFTNLMEHEVGNPYAGIALGILPWCYVFSLVLGILGIVVIWKGVFSQARYERGY